MRLVAWLSSGVYLVDMDPEAGKLQLARDLPATGSGIPGIRYDRSEWPHGKTGPAFAHGSCVWSREMNGGAVAADGAG